MTNNRKPPGVPPGPHSPPQVQRFMPDPETGEMVPVPQQLQQGYVQQPMQVPPAMPQQVLLESYPPQQSELRFVVNPTTGEMVPAVLPQLNAVADQRSSLLKLFGRTSRRGWIGRGLILSVLALGGAVGLYKYTKDDSKPAASEVSKPEPEEKESKEDNKKDKIVLEKNRINERYKTRVLLYEPNPRIIKAIISKFAKNDPLVPAEHAGKRKRKIRSTTNKCLQIARAIAKEQGYDIAVHDGYRTEEEQKKRRPGRWQFYKRWKNRGNKRVASLKGPHRTGGAMDVSLIRLSDGKRMTKFIHGRDKGTECTDVLEFCMNMAGFVRYINETWHFEIGTKKWAKIMEALKHISREDLSKFIYKILWVD